MATEFNSDSLHGLISKLSLEVIDEIKDARIKERGKILMIEIDKRVTSTDEDLVELKESLENIRGML